VDSKFEASFGHQGGDCLHDASKCDWWDTSGVDGFTLPYKVEISDHCKTGGFKGVDIDCSLLKLDECPHHENFDGVGTVDLAVAHPKNNVSVGCYSPCSRLTFSNWGNPLGHHSPADSIASPYCCPTPPVSSSQCRAGPAETSQYTKLIHARCPHVYAYAYDDAVGLQVCPAETVYTWTLFCAEDPPAPSPAPTPSPPTPTPSPPTPAPSPPSPHRYKEYPGHNAYDGNGAINIDSDKTALRNQTPSSCKAYCDELSECDCVTFRPADGWCWRRRACDPAKMATNEGSLYTVFMKTTSEQVSLIV